jgi:hypothetical protein
MRLRIRQVPMAALLAALVFYFVAYVSTVERHESRFDGRVYARYQVCGRQPPGVLPGLAELVFRPAFQIDTLIRRDY